MKIYLSSCHKVTMGQRFLTVFAQEGDVFYVVTKKQRKQKHYCLKSTSTVQKREAGTPLAPHASRNSTLCAQACWRSKSSRFPRSYASEERGHFHCCYLSLWQTLYFHGYCTMTGKVTTRAPGWGKAIQGQDTDSKVNIHNVAIQPNEKWLQVKRFPISE